MRVKTLRIKGLKDLVSGLLDAAEVVDDRDRALAVIQEIQESGYWDRVSQMRIIAALNFLYVGLVKAEAVKLPGTVLMSQIFVATDTWGEVYDKVDWYKLKEGEIEVLD